MNNFTILLILLFLQTAIGAVWFSPLMFGKFWARINGFDKLTKEEQKEAGKKALPYYFIQMFIQMMTNIAILVSSNFLYEIGLASTNVQPVEQLTQEAFQESFQRAFSTFYLGTGTNILIGFCIWLGFMVPVVIQTEIWSKSTNKVKLQKTFIISSQLLITTLLASFMIGFSLLGGFVRVEYSHLSYFYNWFEFNWWNLLN